MLIRWKNKNKAGNQDSCAVIGNPDMSEDLRMEVSEK